MSGPILRTYKAGSIIYFIEDKGTDVFVLQKGRIVLISESIDTHMEVREEVSRGEFFGVKSALGLYPREETAQVLTDCTVLVFSPAVFQAFCMKNSRIVLQMLKVFSGELRKVHRKVRELLGGSGDQDNSVDLLKTAEYFFKKSEMEHGRYAFHAFLNAYPSSELSPRAQRMLSLIESGQPYPLDAADIDQELDNMSGGGFDAQAYAVPVGAVADDVPDIPDMNEIPEMPGDDIPDMGSSGDDFSIPEMPEMPDLPEMPEMPDLPAMPDSFSSEAKSISELYYAGLNNFSQQDWDGALQKYEIILNTDAVTSDADLPFLEKALYEQGRTYQKKGDLSKAFESISKFVKKYPRSALLKKAMIIVGEIYEKKNDKNRALGIYSKVLQLPGKDKDTMIAKQKLERLGA